LEKFWRAHEKAGSSYSEEFKDLINAMLQPNPTHRPTIDEIMAHKWMAGPVPSKQEVYDEMDSRW